MSKIDYMTMHRDSKLQLGFRDVMLSPGISEFTSRNEVNLVVTSRPFSYAKKVTWTGVPIVAANMDTIGTFSMADTLSHHAMSTALHKYYNYGNWMEFLENQKEHDKERIGNHFIYSIGLDYGQFDDFLRVHKKYPFINKLLIDVANGYMFKLHKFIEMIREIVYEDVLIIAGNVVDRVGVSALGKAGADIVKVGIGSGSVCTTRKVAGVGRPQVSAIAECVHSSKNVIPFPMIMADGGCVFPGDVAKSFVAGADFVMLGGMLSGHAEIGLAPVVVNGKEFFEFRGMSSKEANKDRSGSLAVHRAAEGKRVLIPAKPSLDDTIQQIKGGLRSAGTYMGLHLENFSTGSFYMVREQTNDVYGSEE